MNTKTIMKAKKSNLLIDKYPDLVESEWDYEKNNHVHIDVNKITYGSRIKANWHCSVCNGSYEMRVYSKISGQRCPYCVGRRALTGFNDLLTLYPDLIKSEWDWIENDKHNVCPDKITQGSKIKAYWHCHVCHGSYEMTVCNKINGQGCPYCSGKKVLKGFNDLQSQYSGLIASSWDWTENNRNKLKPSEITSHARIKACWHCSVCKGKYEMMVYNKVIGQGCPYCNGKRVLAGFNDLASQYPELVESEWDYEKNNQNGLKPDEITPHSNIKANWHCTTCEGHYEMMVNNKTNGKGCPYCAGARVLQGFNDLASQYPSIASEWYQPMNGSKLQAWLQKAVA